LDSKVEPDQQSRHTLFKIQSCMKEPQHWLQQLRNQGVSHFILSHLGRNVTEAGQDTARTKKAVVCLYYVSGMGMEEIERAISQFGGAFDGSAGPIRSVTSRTCDVLSMIARAAELQFDTIPVRQSATIAVS
jgi:helicase